MNIQKENGITRKKKRERLEAIEDNELTTNINYWYMINLLLVKNLNNIVIDLGQTGIGILSYTFVNKGVNCNYQRKNRLLNGHA